MAAGRDNSSYPGFGHPTMYPTCEKCSGGSVHNPHGSHLTKNHHPDNNKMKNHILVWQAKKS